MTLVRCRFAAIAILLSSAPVSRLAAQVSFEPGPLIGYYAATAPHGGDGQNSPGYFSGRALGAEATAWFGTRFGVRADFAIASTTRTEVVNPGGFEPAHSGSVTAVSALLAFNTSGDSGHSFWIAAGPGYVAHDGKAFESSGNPTDAAAVVGIGSTLSLRDSFRLVIGGSAFLYRYSGMFGTEGGPPQHDGTFATAHFEERFQHDGVVHVAFTWNVQ